jgi:hypothetical protein
MSTFVCTLEQFKGVVAEFCKSAPTASDDALEAGFKCVTLHYLGIEPAPKSGSWQEIIAVSCLNYASNRKIDRIALLMEQSHD